MYCPGALGVLSSLRSQAKLGGQGRHTHLILECPKLIKLLLGLQAPFFPHITFLANSASIDQPRAAALPYQTETGSIGCEN